MNGLPAQRMLVRLIAEVEFSVFPIGAFRSRSFLPKEEAIIWSLGQGL